jgi:hypothetical protein
MINVSKLKKGIVIDHIRAGHGYKIFQQLGLDQLEDVVVLMRNVNSTKMGRKDLIKIETDLELNFDVLGLIETTHARDHRVFPGVMDKDGLGFGERAVVAVVRAPAGDYRPWDEIHAWALGIARDLGHQA